MLRLRGYEVIAASDPVEALELLARDSAAVHLVMTDVVMPEMSGVELARRARELHSDLPVLLMSGYAASSLEETQRLPRHHLLQKPFGSTELAIAVRDALEPAA